MHVLRNHQTRPLTPLAVIPVRTRMSSSPDPPSLQSLLDVTTPEANGEVPTEPSTPTTPISRTRAFSRALQRERSIHLVHAVFHYDRTQNGLQPWFWPVNEEGERVTPSNILQYRQSHEFRTPSCLCASLESDIDTYMESAIFLATSGLSTGEYVAACATGQCRYWVSLERLYDQVGLLVKRYSPRVDTANVTTTPAPPSSQTSAARQLQDLEIHLGSVIGRVVQNDHECRAPPPTAFTHIDSTSIPTFLPESEPGHNFSLLLQLDDIKSPGLTEEAFRELFVRCEAIRGDVSIIDLTNED